MRALLGTTELGGGHRLEWEGRWGDVVLPPFTLATWVHPSPGGGECAAMIHVDSEFGRRLFPNLRWRWELIAAEPMTLRPSLHCNAPGGCGAHGLVRDGKWVPA